MYDQLITAFGTQKVQIRQTRPAQKTSQRSELCYRRLFETFQEGIVLLDATTEKITEANPFLTNLLGYENNEMIGKELWQLGIFKNAVETQKALTELQTIGYIRYIDLPLRTKDGNDITVELLGNAYLAGDEKIIQCTIRDVTERRQAEIAMQKRTKTLEEATVTQEEIKKAMLNIMEDLALAKSIIEEKNAKDEAMLASIGDGLICVDVNGKIILMNASAEDMLGYKEKDLLGKEITCLPLENDEGTILSSEDRPTSIALSTRKSIYGTYIVTRNDHARLPVALTVTPIILNNKIIGALDVFRDISRETEIDKAKSEFVSLASHQLRTPLGIIKWYTEALQNEHYIKKSPTIIYSYIQQIHKNSERILSLVRDLLSVSRIEQRQVKNTPNLTDVRLLIREVIEQMRIIAKKKGITLTLTVMPKKLPEIYIDALRLHEVIENLVGNAIAYTLAGGRVEVRAHDAHGHLIIRIKDTGIGISPADQKKLFSKFFRTEQAAKLNPEGSGLGLYVVKAYLKEWGGSLQMESSRKKGSVFTVFLPHSNKNVLKGGDTYEKDLNC